MLAASIKAKFALGSAMRRASVAAGLACKKKGAQVEVVTPGGAKAFEVIKVEWRYVTGSRTAAFDALARGA